MTFWPFWGGTLASPVWKTKLPLPQWVAEHVDLILPNSTNDFSRFGVSVDVYQRKDLRVTVTGSCGFFGGFDGGFLLGGFERGFTFVASGAGDAFR